MKKVLLAGIAAAAFCGAPAFAADMPTKGPVYKAAPEPMFNWSGFYAGGHCGGAWARSRSSGDPLPGGGFGAFDQTIGVEFKDSASGMLCGAQYGRNWQSGQFVFGLESDLGWIGAKKSAIHVDSNPPDQAFTSMKYGLYSTTTVRLGIAQNTSLYYFKGGLATARIKNVGADMEGPDIDSSDIVSRSKTRFGFAVGGGYEYAFAPRWSVKLEYLYMDFGKYTVHHFDSDFGPPDDTFRFRNSVQTVKIGLNYNFGDPWGKAPVVAKY
jgi:outer membrane immunogenic protein